MADRTQGVEPIPPTSRPGPVLRVERCRICDVGLDAAEPLICGRCGALDALGEILDGIDLAQLPAAEHLVEWVWKNADVVAIEGFRDLLLWCGGRSRR